MPTGVYNRKKKAKKPAKRQFGRSTYIVRDLDGDEDAIAKKPTHTMTMYNDDGAWSVIGYGWKDQNSDAFTITLNMGVVLDWRHFITGRFHIRMIPS